MECFICHSHLATILRMRDHFRIFHNMREIDTYKCTFGNNCNTIITNLRNFIRHVKGHLIVTYPSLTNLSQESTDFSSYLLNNPSTSNCSESRLNTLDEEHHKAGQCEPVHHSNDSLSREINSISIQEGGVAFLLDLHSNSNFTRKNVVEIQNSVKQNLLNPMVTYVKEYIERNLSSAFCSEFKRKLHMTSIAEIMSGSFRSCETEMQLTTWLRENDYLSSFDNFSINREIGEKFIRGEMQHDERNVTGVMLPLSFQFRKIFEKNDQLLKTLDYIDNIQQNKEKYAHFLHGELWREKSKQFLDEGKIPLPFFLYIDDSEVNNPLGPHAEPVTFVYFSFPVIENCDIYLAALIKSHDYKEFGNEKCLCTLVRAVKHLEENGISIRTSQGEKNIHFILGLF